MDRKTGNINYKSALAGMERTYAGPLLNNELFATKTEAETYAADHATAYDGQTVYVAEERPADEKNPETSGAERREKRVTPYLIENRTLRPLAFNRFVAPDELDSLFTPGMYRLTQGYAGSDLQGLLLVTAATHLVNGTPLSVQGSFNQLLISLHNKGSVAGTYNTWEVKKRKCSGLPLQTWEPWEDTQCGTGTAPGPAEQENFVEVTPQNGSITIDYEKAPCARVSLSGEQQILTLNIVHTQDGCTGKILVFQTGFKQIAAAQNIRGTIDIPLNADTVALLSYNHLGDIIYIHSNTVLGDRQFPSPQRVDDLQLTYADASTCSVQWTAPWANNIYDKATEYDIRYANSAVNPNDAKTWAGLKKVDAPPQPLTPGQRQHMTLTGLSANKEYYLYLKSVKVNYGIVYLSQASDVICFKTAGSQDTGKAFRLTLLPENIIPEYKHYEKSPETGQPCRVDHLVDEQANNLYLPDGYPNPANKNYSTYWLTYRYSRVAQPYYILIDLYSEMNLDKLFVLTGGKLKCSLYGMRNLGYAWEKVGEVHSGTNEWNSIDFGLKPYRLLKLAFDLDYFCEGKGAEGAEAWPEEGYNGTLGSIKNLILYGRNTTCPEGIRPPLRKATARKTVDQFFCTNGHFYQQGRIHAMCSGEKVRLYGAYGHFCAFDANGKLIPRTRVSDLTFRTDRIPWVGDSGRGNSLVSLLKNTYNKYGLKPYITATGILDNCQSNINGFKNNAPVDDYFTENAWRPIPSVGVGGRNRYFGITQSGLHYGSYGKAGYVLAAKFGRQQKELTTLVQDEELESGLNYLSGTEPGNEPDVNWLTWKDYRHSEEIAALMSAATDGHADAYRDEEGNGTVYGIKKADSNFLSIFPGTAGTNAGYFLEALLWWKANRSDGSVPIDAWSTHMYFSNVGNQDASRDEVQYGIPFEEAMKNDTGKGLAEAVQFRNQYCPDKEIWLTEFGWGESGVRNGSCKYQCYTQAGRQIGQWILPDRHRSDVKGAWIVRACVQLMHLGVDMVNYYSTETEGNYFGAGNYDTGAGFEMFHWTDCTDLTPGARAEAIRKHEHTFSRGGFATTGLFGSILSQGAYPITRAYWWVATLRTRLKGYLYTGMKYIEADSRIVVACFKKQDEEKGAYLVYLNHSQNTGVPNVEIPVPDGIHSVQHVTVYVPDLPNPENVPGTLAWDRRRKGMPTARHERFEQGQWIVTNQPVWQSDQAAYTQAPGSYPDAPQEGDEVVTLPTTDENPYFPIVGPVQAKRSPHGNVLNARQFEQDREEWQTEPNVDDTGAGIWEVKQDSLLAWRQVDAVCDYIEHHPQGIHGCRGDEETLTPLRGAIRVNVSEFPEYFFFEAVPEPDYRSEVSHLSAQTLSASAVELWWNNTNTEDTGYQLLVSSLPETGYTLLKEVPAGVQNRTLIAGLQADTTYYYKIRPLRNAQTGTLSNYTSARTFTNIEAPENLRAEARTATSITLAWDYTEAQVADFVHYAIVRTDQTGQSIPLAQVEDKLLQRYQDTELPTGHTYRYKVRAVGLNGQSAYTPELEVRTLLPQECSPLLQSALTDKLGRKITLAFDLSIGNVAEEAKNNFILTEDGSPRLVQRVHRDEANPQQLIIDIPEDSLKDYDRKSDLRIGYTNRGQIESAYGIPLQAWSEAKVVNRIGNFTNREALYKINLCAHTDATPQDTEWNNFRGSPNLTELSMPLTDSYGRNTGVSAHTVMNPPYQVWGGVHNSGFCTIQGVEPAVYSTGWITAFGAWANEERVARLKCKGLNNEHKYTVKAYGGTKFGEARSARIKVNGLYSQEVEQLGNLQTYMTVEDCTPRDKELCIDLIYMTENPRATGNPRLCFLEVEEFRSNDEPENADLFLRSATVTEDQGNGVKTPNLHIALNCIGTLLHYRISEQPDFAHTEWKAVTDALLTVPYTLSDGFGSKKIYVQGKNLHTESNVRIIELEYRDPYVPLALNSIYINNGQEQTTDTHVTLMVVKDGMPTHYKAAEQPDLSHAPWIPWPEDAPATVPFVLSPGEGEKTVYLSLMDSLSTTPVKSDSIRYNDVWKDALEAHLSIEIPQGTDPDTLKVRFAPLKYNKRFGYGYGIDDGTVQAYSIVHNYFNGKWVDDQNFHHLGMERTTGFTPQRALYYTDGCGTRRRFVTESALIPLTVNAEYSRRKLEENPVPTNPYLRFAELSLLQDFDSSWRFHNIDDSVWDKNDPVQIGKGITEVQEYMQSKGAGTAIIMGQPDGNENYNTASIAHPDIYSWNSPREPGPLDVMNSRMVLDKLAMPRAFDNTEQYEPNLACLEEIVAKSVPGVSACLNEFGTHRVRGNDNQGWPHRKQLFDYLFDTYAGGGSDEVWMGTYTEFYQYLYINKQAQVNTTLEGNVLRVHLRIPRVRNFNWFETTLLLDAIRTDTPVTGSDAIVGLTSGLNRGSLMINVNLDTTLIDRAEKYTHRFEQSNEPEDRDDAEYFIQRLKPSLREPYRARIAEVTATPALSAFSINSGAETTDSLEVTCTFTCSSQAKDYLISEHPDFRESQWTRRGEEPSVRFHLSDVKGEHRIYMKVKNAAGMESETVTDTIWYEPLMLELTALTINGNAESTTSGRVSVSFTYVGTPAWGRVGTTADLSEVSWSSFSALMPFELDHSTVGLKTLYGQLKDNYGTESAVCTDSITLREPDPVMTVVSFSGIHLQVSHPLVGEKVINLIGSAVNSRGEDLTLLDSTGTASAKYLNNYQQEPGDNGANDAVRKPTVTDFGPYPGSYLTKFLCSSNRELKMVLKFGDFAAGTYNIRILVSYDAQGIIAESKLASMMYELNGIRISPTENYVDNVDRFMTAQGVVIGPNGSLIIRTWNTSGSFYHPGLNLVEIIKVK